jgi:hypothetical protein
MARSCGTVQNFFRQVGFHPAMRRNQAILDAISAAALRQGPARALLFRTGSRPWSTASSMRPATTPARSFDDTLRQGSARRRAR